MAQPEPFSLPEAIGRYRVDRLLGAGGMGVVYACYDSRLERRVAVKLLRGDRVQGELEVAGERLREEAKITARLAHPNVVTIYEVGDWEGGVYIAMELVDGPSLDVWMREVARPWREVLTMFFQAGRGLAAAHAAGLIHRDFKPANVLVGGTRARVGDFGLARIGSVAVSGHTPEDRDVLSTDPGPGESAPSMPVDTSMPPGPTGGGVLADTTPQERLLETGSLADVLSTVRGDDSLAGVTLGGDGPLTVPNGVTSTGHFVGTPAYMAPEQFSGGTADPRTDQFAYCVALYEGLYGHRPFVGETASAIAEAVVAGKLRREGRNRVPLWLRNIIIRGLEVEPERRHESIKSLLAAIWFTANIMFE